MSELVNAIKHVCEEKGLSYEAVLGTIESALAAAYRKDFGKKNQNIKVEFDPEVGKSKVYDVKTVVEDLPEETADDVEKDSGDAEEKKKDKKNIDSANKTINDEKGQKKSKEEKSEEREDEEGRKFNPKTEIQLSDAKLIKKNAKVGDEIRIKLEPPKEYGRMAAQTAKQVIIQKLREAEREMVYNDFKSKEHEVISGVVQRREGRIVLVDLGKVVGVLPPEEVIPTENYRPGERIKVYVKEVNAKPKGPEIILSRRSEEILKKVFYLEIPEIANGLIELKSVAREAGFRSKVAVAAESENVDPIGSCVGQRGARIQTIINELGGEKVDIIAYDEDPEKFITNALSPAKIMSIEIDEKNKKAVVQVSSDQLSLAIGKGGQNARLAAKLTGWKIDIIEAGGENKGGYTADKNIDDTNNESTDEADIDKDKE
jgi:N utilization substance protein A